MFKQLYQTLNIQKKTLFKYEYMEYFYSTLEMKKKKNAQTAVPNHRDLLVM